MSGTAVPGQPFVTTISSPDITKFECTVSNGTVIHDAVELADGTYRITIAGSDVKCPGPIIFFQDGVQVQVTIVSPCP
jgi:hypothetical protein